MAENQNTHVAKVETFLDNLKNADWLGASRRWWPNFIYHFTDVRNAVSILEQGALFSRNESLRRGLMATDNASPQVIGQTEEQLKDYVRLYFRPRTPTQYRNEGFRPIRHYWQGAHCPVPVYFLFDSQTVLSLPKSHFSDGNLASHIHQILSTAPELEQMPFIDIYQDGSLPDDEERRRQIISRKQAEIIVSNRLDLDALKFIVCRSEAERQTLIHLLTPQSRERWQNKVIVDPDQKVFYKHWLYVATVELSDSSIVFNFNLSSDSEYNGPFHAVASITDMQNGKRFTWRSEQFIAKSKLKLSGFPPLDGYSIKFSLDDQIGYAGRYQAEDPDDLPW